MTAAGPDGRHGRTGALVGAGVGLAAGLAVLAPVLGRGFVLSYDMVFVPDPPITAALLGADGSVPRAVPTELVVDLLATVLPAQLVQQAVLLAVFVLAGWGAARLVPGRAGAAGAALAYTWTPYVAERLVIGHWTYLLGYALLPWVTGAALAARRGGRLASLLLWLGAAALAGATSALLATGTALAVLALPGQRGERTGSGPARVAAVLGFAAVANAAWLVPALTRPGGLPADPAGVPAFAARADTPLGLAGSLVTLGGVWNPAAWPAGRDSVLAAVALAAVAAALALGLRPLLARTGPGPLVAAAVALVLAAAGAVPVLDDLLTAVVEHVPGGGLLRDGQKLLAPAALLVALTAGHAVAALAARRGTVPYAVLLGVLPVLALPSLGWGVGGRLGPADYPPSWTALRAAVTAAPPGEVAALPWTLYRRLDFAGGRVVLDPLPRLLDRRVLVDDDLPLTAGTVRGEDARSAQVTAGLAAGRPLPELLRAAGARYAVVHRGQPGAADAEAALAGLPVRLDNRDLLLVELPGRPAGAAAPPADRPWVAAVGLGLTAAALAGAAAAMIHTAGRPRLLRSPAPSK